LTVSSAGVTLPTLTAEAVRLREFTVGDIDALHRVYGDPAATRHLSFEPRTRDQVAEVIAGIVERRATVPRVEFALAVERLDRPDMIGMARLALSDNSSAQIGFALRPDQWGRGLGRQTVRLLLDLGFAHLGLHRVWGARAPDNEASRRLMVSMGMVEEGRIRHHVLVRGAWRDSIVHSILETEWHGRNGSRRPPARAGTTSVLQGPGQGLSDGVSQGGEVTG
jgi:RimJ/RimL family protein N-acetyltransferase